MNVLVHVWVIAVCQILLSSPQAKNARTNEVVAIKKMNFSGDKSVEVRLFVWSGKSTVYVYIVNIGVAKNRV